MIAEYLGLNPQPTFYAETLCSSGSTGLRLAYSLVASGLHDVVMVIGFQIMSQLTSAESQERMGRGADIQWESPFGTMMPAYYAMHARAHMAKFGTTMEDLALIRVKAGTYGPLNPNAVYRKPVTLEQFQDPGSFLSGLVAGPLRAGDCCANADGSSCVIVACEEKARAFSKKAGLDQGDRGRHGSRQHGRTRSAHRSCGVRGSRRASLQDGRHYAR